MSNELTNFDPSQLPTTQLGTNDVFEDLSKSADFIGRLKLYTKGKPIDKGLIGPGRYGIPVDQDEIADLGNSIDIVPLARTPFAIDMSDRDAVIRAYDHEGEQFQRIAEKSMEKESNCQYGPRFLVFERSTGRFLEFFCGSKSLRSFSKTLYAYLPLTKADIEARKLEKVEPHSPKPVTLKVRLVEKGDFSWHVPTAHKCSAPFNNFPTTEAITKEIIKFLDVKDDEVERVEEKGKGKRRAR